MFRPAGGRDPGRRRNKQLEPGTATTIDWPFISVPQDMGSGARDKWGSLCDEGIPGHVRYLGESVSGRKRKQLSARLPRLSVCLQVHSQPGGKRDRNIPLHVEIGLELASAGTAVPDSSNLGCRRVLTVVDIAVPR